MLAERIEVGVVIARFQVENLTPAHTKLLDWVYKNHPKMIVFLGISPAILSRRDPLDYEARRMMIQTKYPNADIIGIKDVGVSNQAWSQKLDTNIVERYPLSTVRLYGGRDSFACRYTGRYQTVDLTQAVPEIFAEMGDVSGTHERADTVFAGPRNSSDFRAGVIYAAYKQKPKVYPTVDVALLGYDHEAKSWEVVLAQRAMSDELRFPGGFVDPTDPSFEVAALREMREETGLNLELLNLEHLGSFPVDDWRYPGPDRILTTFYVVQVQRNMMPDTISALDDIAKAAWHPVNEATGDFISPDHTLLWQRLLQYIEKTTRYRETEEPIRRKVMKEMGLI